MIIDFPKSFNILLMTLFLIDLTEIGLRVNCDNSSIPNGKTNFQDFVLNYSSIISEESQGIMYDNYWSSWFLNYSFFNNFDFFDHIVNVHIPHITQSIVIQGYFQKLNLIKSNKDIYYDKDYLYDKDLKIPISKILEVKSYDIINNKMFMRFINATLVNETFKNVYNQSDIIDYDNLDLMVEQYFKGNNTNLKIHYEQHYYIDSLNGNIEESYLFILNLKLMYYRYGVFSQEYINEQIYHWNITIEDIIRDKEFIDQYNNTELLEILKSLSEDFKLKSSYDYDEIDFAIEIAEQLNYEYRLFNKSEFLSDKVKQEIKYILDLKSRFIEFTKAMMPIRYQRVKSNLTIQRIYDDIEYRDLIPDTEWSAIGKFARNITNNHEIFKKINWTEFNLKYNDFINKYNKNFSEITDWADQKFHEIYIFEQDYLKWKKNKIYNPQPRIIKPNKTSSIVNNTTSSSIFSDIGINIHNSLQPISLSTKVQNCNAECKDDCLLKYALHSVELKNCINQDCNCINTFQNKMKIVKNDLQVEFRLFIIYIIIFIFAFSFIYWISKNFARIRNSYQERNFDHYIRLID